MQRLLTALATGVPNVPVERNRRADVASGDAPVLVLFDGDHHAQITDFGDMTYDMMPSIEGTVTAMDDATLGTALNALYEAARSAIMADPALGGAAQQVSETGLTVQIVSTAESTDPLATFNLALSVQFRTPDGTTAGLI